MHLNVHRCIFRCLPVLRLCHVTSEIPLIWGMKVLFFYLKWSFMHIYNHKSYSIAFMILLLHIATFVFWDFLLGSIQTLQLLCSFIISSCTQYNMDLILLVYIYIKYFSDPVNPTMLSVAHSFVSLFTHTFVMYSDFTRHYIVVLKRIAILLSK